MPSSKLQYCGGSCAMLARVAGGTAPRRPRTVPDAICRQCGKTFHPSSARQAVFCDSACYTAWKRRLLAAPHPCALGAACLRPQELIDPRRLYHPECYAAWRAAGFPGKLRAGHRCGAELFCSRCGTSLGYHPPSRQREHRCRACARIVRSDQAAAARVVVTCAWCWKLGDYAGARFSIPPARAALPAQHRFHNASERSRFFGEVFSRRRRCPQCGHQLRRPDQTYCSRTCFAASRRGKPLGSPSPAEERILEAWASGVRGVRPLARASSTATFNTSTNTVQRMYREGKLVEPAPAREIAPRKLAAAGAS